MLSVCFTLLLFQQPVLDMGGKLSPNQAAIDTRHMRLVLSVDPDTKTIDGFVETTYALATPGPTSLDLELVDSLKVSEARIDGQVRPFKHGDNKLSISLPQTHGNTITARIAYSGSPREAVKPPWDGGFNWSRTDSGKPWVGVSCQGEGGQVWYPCKGHQVDKIEGLKLEITVPQPLYVAANGLLEKIEDAGDGKRTFHWASNYPIASYNVSINIADYQVVETTYHGSKDMPVMLYMLKEYQKADQASGDKPYAEKVENLKNLVVAYLTGLSKFYGEYPFIDEKFALAHTHYLGMEHQTINSYGGHFFQRNGIDGLMIHEMGHEWWGNKLTVGDLADFWLQEGICTYSTGVYVEDVEGLDAALRYYRGLRFRIANEKPLVQGDDITQGQAYIGDIYNKGALVIHAMRWLLGKEVSDGILHDLMNDPAHTYRNTAANEDLLAHAERRAGRKLSWFFDRYLLTAQPPKLSYHAADGVLHLAWDTESFDMPVELGVTQNGETRYERVAISGGKATWTIPEGADYEIDPRAWVYMLTEKTSD